MKSIYGFTQSLTNGRFRLAQYHGRPALNHVPRSPEDKKAAEEQTLPQFWLQPGSLVEKGLDAIKAQAPSWLSPQKLLALEVLSPAQVDRICSESRRTQFLIEGFLPTKSIAIAAGDSAIGKSALICQLGLCVASGTPFLGKATIKGPVLYFDLENSLSACQKMRQSLVGFLGLSEAPGSFLLVQDPLVNLEKQLAEVKPKLVVFDSLRSYRPDVTEKNRPAAEWLQTIRRMSREYDCTFLIVHHLRKTNRAFAAPALATCGAATWLQEMEGPRAFVNQSDVRIAVEEGDGSPASLHLKWSLRVQGDSPMIPLERVFDDDEPIGYQCLTGSGLLSKEKLEVFNRLQEEFRTADAKEARRLCNLGDGNDPTNKFLEECKHLNIIEKVEKGIWRKKAA